MTIKPVTTDELKPFSIDRKSQHETDAGRVFYLVRYGVSIWVGECFKQEGIFYITRHLNPYLPVAASLLNEIYEITHEINYD